MQISLNWVNELVNIKTIKLELLIEKLTLGGFEVEEILEIQISDKTHILLDISATANRSDSLSIHGISKEIAALLDLSINYSKHRRQNKSWKKTIENKIQKIPENPNYSIFITVIIENLTNLTIPKWMQQKLLCSNMTLTNNLIDFQNYILLETGYPFEVYDFESICSILETSNFTLEIQNCKNTSSFIASNNLNYNLNSSVLTLNANKLPISIMGLIASKNFSISEKTTKLLIEGSIFKSAKIRQQSRKLGLRTDRSAKYEKSLKNNYLIEALYRFISLLRISNPNLICKFHTIQKEVEPVLEKILLKYETINEILGPILNSKDVKSKFLSPITITDYLKRLNFKFIFNERDLSWEVEKQPSRIDDISREIDLIEEIGRLHGFNNFITRLPRIERIGKKHSNYKIRKKITTYFLNLGLNELIHYSLVNEEKFIKNEIEIINPLLGEYSKLRASLLPGLLKTVQENSKQKNLPMEGFEYGHVFELDSVLKFVEKEKIGGIFGGLKTKLSWSNLETGLSWFEAKGKMEQFLKQLNLATDWKTCSDLKIQKLLHPYRSAEIYLENGLKLGLFGQVNPMISNQFKISDEIYLFEFDIEILKLQVQKNKLAFYKPYSLYPKIIKDLSFVIQKDISFQEVQTFLYSNGTEFLSQVNLLDEYRGKSIASNSTSLCFQLIFHSDKKTLKTKTIENIIIKLQELLVQKFHAILRN